MLCFLIVTIQASSNDIQFYFVDGTVGHATINRESFLQGAVETVDTVFEAARSGAVVEMNKEMEVEQISLVKLLYV